MAEVPYTEHGFGLFGPDFGVPEGGFCLSVFVILEREGRLLAGRMDPAQADAWIEGFAPNLAFYEGERRARLFEGERFPATYLREGEHPDDAARRVITEQLGLEAGPTLGLPAIVSAAGSSRRSPSARHWDVLFCYRVEGPELPETVPDLWTDLTYQDPDALAEGGMVMLHGELFDVL